MKNISILFCARYKTKYIAEVSSLDKIKYYLFEFRCGLIITTELI